MCVEGTVLSLGGTARPPAPAPTNSPRLAEPPDPPKPKPPICPSFYIGYTGYTGPSHLGALTLARHAHAATGPVSIVVVPDWIAQAALTRSPSCHPRPRAPARKFGCQLCVLIRAATPPQELSS